VKYLISAGHSATDPGACAHGHTEAAIALEMRYLVAKRLLEMRHAVLMDGNIAENLPLKTALKLIKGTDLAVELHCNAAANMQATGVEVIAPAHLKLVAQRIARAIAAETGQKLRGELGWIDQAQSARGRVGFIEAGGLIVEMVFISNLGDLRTFLAAKERVAMALAGAICAYEVAS
jgi:N-acetylmuramoyl-L-alanine amidase